MRIDSAANETIKRYASLKEKKYRQMHGMYLLEGERLVKDALLSGVELAAVFVREDCESLVKEFCVPEDKTYIVSERAYRQLCDTLSPQGITAAARIPQSGGRGISEKALLLDGISDSGNLGALIRSAAGFGYQDVILIGCADPYSPKTVRSTMSGVFKVNIRQCGYEILEELKSGGVRLICADMGGEDASAYRPEGKFALCIGSEAHGLSTEVIAAADITVAIKQRNIESLNAAIAGSILMYLYS